MKALWSCAAILLLGGLSVLTSIAQETPIDAGPGQTPPAAVTVVPLTIHDVESLLKDGFSSTDVIKLIKSSGGIFDLTIEDTFHLRQLGASTELVRLIATLPPPPPPPPAPVPVPAPEPEPPAPAVETPAQPEPAPPQPVVSEPLTARAVLKMYKKAVPPEEIATLVRRQGLDVAPTLDDLIAYRKRGVPVVIVRALAQSGPAAITVTDATHAMPAEGAPEQAAEPAKPPRKKRPMKVAEVIAMVERGDPGDSVAAAITERGVREAPTLDELMALRAAGADDTVIEALNQSAVAGKTPETVEETPTDDVPTSQGLDRVWVASIPRGARVYVSPSSSRREEMFRYEDFVGETPVSLDLAPGDYNIVVQKNADALENSLLPAWRTIHDLPGTRSVLDNAMLAFDPNACCLPSSLTGKADVYPVGKDQERDIIGDRFDGLSPYLFDGETLQVLDVKKSRIRAAFKAYSVKKFPSRSRLLVATFIPSEGDPLDQSTVAGLPPGAPYRGTMAQPGLDFLTSPDGLTALAGILGVEPDQVSEAARMLERAGKTIIHQQVEGGLRLISAALDDWGGFRLIDRTVRPFDPFAPPPPKKPRKKAPVAAPPAAPPLPVMERLVTPGSGLPRLSVDNTSSKAIAFSLSDGQFFFVPAKTSREFVVEPGSYDARLLDKESIANPPRGRVHFAYHARYNVRL